MLTSGHPALWAMICLEALNGVGGALFYPASQALLPQIAPDALLQEGSSISRLAMNTGQMTGAAAAGLVVAAFGPGWALIELMMVQWTVQMATRIPSDKLARVSSYDALGSMAAMPVGALLAGPLAAAIGVSTTQFAAVAVIVVASALTLIPREIWTIRFDDVVRGVTRCVAMT